MKKAPLPPNPHPRKNFYNGPWLMLRPVFCRCWWGIFVALLPFGHRVQPPAKFGTPARRAFSPSRRGVASICRPAGTPFRPPAKLGTPARRAFSPSRVVLRVFVALRAHHFALRRSLGRLRGARQGGAGYGAAPPSRPPLHPPRSTPKEESSIPFAWRGQRGCSCGSFLHSLHSFR